MALKRHWIPPPCQTAVASELRKENKVQPKKEEVSVAEIISKELGKLECLVESLDDAFKDLKTQAYARIQNETDLEKEQKYVCEAFSNMNIWQGEQQKLLKEVLSEMNTINSNLTVVLKDSKDNSQKKDSHEINFLQEALHFLERRYKKDVGYLKKRALSHKLHSKELHFSVKDLNRKLLEKEELVKSLTQLCDELKSSLTDVTNQKVDLQASVQKLQEELNACISKPSSGAVNISSPRMVSSPEKQGEDLKTNRKLQHKIFKLEKENHEYLQQLKILERKLKKTLKKSTSTQSNAETEKGTSTMQKAEVTETPEEAVTIIQKLKEELDLQLKEVSSLQDELHKKSNDMQALTKENEQLKLKHIAEIAFLKSELQKSSESESGLRSQLQQLKRSYATVFSDPSLLNL